MDVFQSHKDLPELCPASLVLFPYSTISDISILKLKVDKCSRQDTVFMKKVGQVLEAGQEPGGVQWGWVGC